MKVYSLHVWYEHRKIETLFSVCRLSKLPLSDPWDVAKVSEKPDSGNFIFWLTSFLEEYNIHFI